MGKYVQDILNIHRGFRLQISPFEHFNHNLIASNRYLELCELKCSYYTEKANQMRVGLMIGNIRQHNPVGYNGFFLGMPAFLGYREGVGRIF